MSSVQNHHLQLKGSNYRYQRYMSIENTGDSYNIKPLADNMDLYTGGASDTKTATSWGTKYKNAFNRICSCQWWCANICKSGGSKQYARAQADASRVKPGTPAFKR